MQTKHEIWNRGSYRLEANVCEFKNWMDLYQDDSDSEESKAREGKTGPTTHKKSKNKTSDIKHQKGMIGWNRSRKKPMYSCSIIGPN